MRCDICEDERVEITHMDEVHGEGDEMYVIRNIPVYSCPHCHEEHLASETIDELERLELHHEILAEKKFIGMIDFIPATSELVPVTR